jgi:K+-transporting ATPase ATPase C chain
MTRIAAPQEPQGGAALPADGAAGKLRARPTMAGILRPAVSLLLALTVVTGGVYPLLVAGAGSALFAHEAAGSLVTDDGGLRGSALIGQSFSDPGHFWGRPSATSPQPYNAISSTGSNLGPSNPALIDAVRARVDALRKADPENRLPIPVDLVTASASGLDPDISPGAARYQSARVARVRGLSRAQIEQLIDAATRGRQWGVLGEPRVNVLQLNRALDQLH